MRRTPPPGADPGPDESLDQLVGDWWIYQLRRGHRFSTDDMVAAWCASRTLPRARRLLDLGSGVGSVGLYTLGLLPHDEATLVGIEAQEVSVGLARRSLALNGLTARVRFHHGDLRDRSVLPEGATFELVTGSPPYFPPGTGVMSPHPQRRACRFELRGSAVDYCHAAKHWMAPQGRFVMVMAAADPRLEEGPVQAGLTVVERTDVVFRDGEEPLVAVVVCAHADEVADDAPRTTRRIQVRGPDGQWTEDYRALRRAAGFGDG